MITGFGCALTDEDIRLAQKYVIALIKENDYNSVEDIIKAVYNELIKHTPVDKAVSVALSVPQILMDVQKNTDADWYSSIQSKFEQNKLYAKATNVNAQILDTIDKIGIVNNPTIEQLLGVNNLIYEDLDYIDSVQDNVSLVNKIEINTNVSAKNYIEGNLYSIDGIIMRCAKIDDDNQTVTFEYRGNAGYTQNISYSYATLNALKSESVTLKDGKYNFFAYGKEVTVDVKNGKIVSNDNFAYYSELFYQRGGKVRYTDTNGNNSLLDVSALTMKRKGYVINGKVVDKIAIVAFGNRYYYYPLSKDTTFKIGDKIKSKLPNWEYGQIVAIRSGLSNINGDYTIQIWNKQSQSYDDYTVEELAEYNGLENIDNLELYVEQIDTSNLVVRTNNVENVSNVEFKFTTQDDALNSKIMQKHNLISVNGLKLNNRECYFVANGHTATLVYKDTKEPVLFDSDGNVSDAGSQFVLKFKDDVTGAEIEITNQSTKLYEKFDENGNFATKDQIVKVSSIGKANRCQLSNRNGKQYSVVSRVNIDGVDYVLSEQGTYNDILDDVVNYVLYLQKQTDSPTFAIFGSIWKQLKDANPDEIRSILTNKQLFRPIFYNGKYYSPVGEFDEFEDLANTQYFKNLNVGVYATTNGDINYEHTYTVSVKSTPKSDERIDEQIEEVQPPVANEVVDDKIGGDEVQEEFATDEEAEQSVDDLFQTEQVRVVTNVTEQQKKIANQWWKNHKMNSKKYKVKLVESDEDMGDVLASWSKHLITLYKGSDSTSKYHEAFHEMFNVFLNNKQREKLYSDLRNESGSFTTYKGNTVEFKNASDVELEEYMAEGFRTYMLNNQKETGFFKWLINVFKNILKQIKSFITRNNETAKNVELTLKTVYEDLKVGNLSKYEKTAETTTENITRQQNILQRDGNLTKDVLNEYKIGNKTLRSYANDIALNEANRRIDDWNKKNPSSLRKHLSKNQINDTLFDKIWPSIKDKVNELINDAIDGNITTADMKTLKLKKNGEEISEIPSGDTDTNNVAVEQDNKYSLSSRYSRDVNNLIVSLYVKYMNEQLGKVTFLEFRNMMASEKYQKEFFNYAFDEISKMTPDEQYKDVIKFVLANFGNLDDINANLQESNGLVYGVIGYFMKKNKLFFSKTVAADEIYGESEIENQTQYLAAIMDWTAGGDESTLADMLKDEVKLIVSTVPRYDQSVDANGKFVEENFAPKKEKQHNKFSSMFDGNDADAMVEFQLPRIVINKIQEIVKDTPNFEDFVRKFRDAVTSGSSAIDLLGGKTIDAKYVDSELLEVYNRLGAITQDEIDNKTFNNRYKAMMWRLFFQSFNNARIQGQLMRINIDYTLKDDSGDFVSKSSVISGSAADRDALSVLDTWFKNDMFANFKRDLFGLDGINKKADRITALAKRLSKRVGSTSGREVSVIKVSNVTSTNGIPEDVLKYAQDVNGTIVRLQDGDIKQYKSIDGNTIYEQCNYVFVVVSEDETKTFKDRELILQTDGELKSFVDEIDLTDTQWYSFVQTKPSLVADYLKKDGISMSGSVNGNYLNTRAVCGMLILNGFVEFPDDAFDSSVYDPNKYSVDVFAGYDEYGFPLPPKQLSSGMYLFDKLHLKETKNQDKKYKEQIIKNRFMVLNALGLFPHRVKKLYDYISSNECYNHYTSMLDNLFKMAYSDNYQMTSLFDVFSDGSQAYYLLQNVLETEREYINNNASFSQRTGDDTNFFENALNNTMSLFVNNINEAIDKCSYYEQGVKKLDKEALANLIKTDKNLEFLNPDRNPMLKHSIIYKLLFSSDNGLFGDGDVLGNVKSKSDRYIELPEGFKLKLDKLSGIELSANGSHVAGSNAYQADQTSRYTNDILLALDGVFSPIQHSDKKSVYAMGVNANFNVVGKSYSRSYISLSECNSNQQYQLLAKIMIDKALGDVEYYQQIQQRLNDGTLGKCDYRVAKKTNRENSTIYNILKRAGFKDVVKLYEILEDNSNATVADIISKLNEESADAFTNLQNSLKTLVESECDKIFEDYGDFYMPTNVVSRVKKQTGNTQLDNKAMRQLLINHYFINDLVHALEMTTLLYGNLSQYKLTDFVKRVGAFGSTGYVVDVSEFASNQIKNELDAGLNNKMPANLMQARAHLIYGESDNVESMKNHHSDIVEKSAWGEKMITMVVNDYKAVSLYAKTYMQIFNDYGDKTTAEYVGRKYGAKVKNDKHEHPYDESNAFAVIGFDKYRQYLMFEQKWTSEHEKMYQQIIHGEKVDPHKVTKLFMPIKAQYLGQIESSMDNVAFHKYQLFPLVPTMYKEGSKVCQIHDMMMKNGIAYITFKSGSKITDITDADGNLQDLFTDDAKGVMNLNKNLGYKKVGNIDIKSIPQQKTPISVTINENTVEVYNYYKGNRGTIFAYANKFYFMQLGDDGKLMHPEIATADTIIDDYTTVIYTQYLRDQLVIHDEFEENVVLPTQLRKLLLSNFFDNGVPVDYKGGDWSSLEENEKEKASSMYRKTKRYINSLRELRRYKKNELLKQLCDTDENGLPIKVNENGVKVADTETGNYKFNIAKVNKWIKKLLEEKEMPDEFKDYFELVDGKFKHNMRTSMNFSILESLIVSHLDKQVTQFRVHGETLVQASNTLFEDNIQFTRNENDLQNLKVNDKDYAFPKNGTNGLNFYTLDEKGNVVSMKVKIPLCGKFKFLLDEFGGDLDALNKALQDKTKDANGKTWFDRHKDMLTMIAVRIPTQGHNSIEMMEVYEFLPPEAPNSIILPSEIVIKSGGDYDIDKMPIMMPHISKLRSVATNSNGEIIRDGNGKLRTSTKIVHDNDNVLNENVISNSISANYLELKYTTDVLLREVMDSFDKTFDSIDLFNTIDDLNALNAQLKELLEKRNSVSEENKQALFGNINAIKERIIDKRVDVVNRCTKVIERLKDTHKNLKSNEDAIKILSCIDYLTAVQRNVASSTWYDIYNRYKLELGKDATEEQLDAIYDKRVNTLLGEMSINELKSINVQSAKDINRVLYEISSKLKDGSFKVKDDERALADEIINLNADIEANKELLREYKNNSIENEFQSSVLDILSDPSTFTTLITPNDTNVYKEVIDKKSTDKNVDIFDLVNPRRNLEERLKFVAGKESLGIAAVDNVLAPIFIQIGLTTRQYIYDNETKKVSDVPVHLGFKHNVGVGGSIDLSSIYDASEKPSSMLTNILNKINQLINGFVDVAKGAWVKDIGADKTRTPGFLFMLQAGCSVNDIVALMDNPLVEKYCSELEKLRGATDTSEAFERSPMKIFKRILDSNSALVQDNLTINGDEFKASKFNLATLLNGVKLSSDENLNVKIDSQKKVMLSSGEQAVELKPDEIALLEFINIKYMADDLTDLKLKIAQDTHINKTSYDIDENTDLSDSSFFDINQDMLQDTVLGIFNDKQFISDAVKFIEENSVQNMNVQHVYNMIDTFVDSNKDKLKMLGQGTVGEVKQQLINIANMMMYQRANRKIIEQRVNELAANIPVDSSWYNAFLNHNMPMGVNITSYDEYVMFRRMSLYYEQHPEEIHKFIKTKVLAGYENTHDDYTKADKDAFGNKVSAQYAALYFINNHDVLFNGDISFPKMFEYMMNKYDFLKNEALFELVHRTQKGNVDLLALDSTSLDDIDAIRESIEVLSDTKYLKEKLDGMKDIDVNIEQIKMFIDYLKEFVLMQSDNSVDGVFGVSKIGSDRVRADVIETFDSTLSAEEVFINWRTNLTNSVAKMFDGYVHVTHNVVGENINSYVEINGKLYSAKQHDGSYNCTPVLQNIAGLSNSTMMNFNQSVDDVITTLNKRLKKFEITDLKQYDTIEIGDKQFVKVGYAYYDAITNERIYDTELIDKLNNYGSENIMGVYNVDNIIYDKKMLRKLPKDKVIDTTEYNKTSGVTFANPFLYDSFINEKAKPINEREAIKAYEQLLRGKFSENPKENVIKYKTYFTYIDDMGYEVKDEATIVINTTYKSFSCYYQGNLVGQTETTQKSAKNFVDSLVNSRDKLAEMIASGVLTDKVLYATGKTSSDNYDEQGSVEYNSEHPSSAMVLEKFISNPTEMVDYSNKLTVAGVNFDVDERSNYDSRTKKNAELADVTVAIAVDFNSYGEKSTKRFAGKNYVAIDYNAENVPQKVFDKLDSIIDELSGDEIVINVAGNSLETLNENGRTITQSDGNNNVDKNIANKLQQIVDYINKNYSGITISFRSGGQSGVDEAGIKFAVKNNFKATVLAPRGWRFIEKNKDGDYYSTANERKFKQRFGKVITEDAQNIYDYDNSRFNRDLTNVDVSSKYIDNVVDGLIRDRIIQLFTAKGDTQQRLWLIKHVEWQTQIQKTGLKYENEIKLDDAISELEKSLYYSGLSNDSYNIIRTENGAYVEFNKDSVTLDLSNIKDVLVRNTIDDTFGDLFGESKALRVLNYLSNKFGIKYKFVSEDEAKRILHIRKDRPLVGNAFVSGNNVYFIQGRHFNSDIAAEEMLHPLVASIKINNPDAYKSLLRDARKLYPKLAKEIEVLYNASESRDEELVTQALSRAFNNDFEQGVERNNIKELLKHFIQSVLDLFYRIQGSVLDDEYKNRLRVRTDELVDTITIDDLAKIINSEIKFFNSELNKFSDVRYNRDLIEVSFGDNMQYISGSMENAYAVVNSDFDVVRTRDYSSSAYVVNAIKNIVDNGGKVAVIDNSNDNLVTQVICNFMLNYNSDSRDIEPINSLPLREVSDNEVSEAQKNCK